MTNPENKEVLKSCPIKSVYGKYEHLDVLLSDDRWMKLSVDEGTSPILDAIMFDLWKAIKEFNTRASDKQELDKITAVKFYMEYSKPFTSKADEKSKFTWAMFFFHEFCQRFRLSNKDGRC